MLVSVLCHFAFLMAFRFCTSVPAGFSSRCTIHGDAAATAAAAAVVADDDLYLSLALACRMHTLLTKSYVSYISACGRVHWVQMAASVQKLLLRAPPSTCSGLTFYNVIRYTCLLTHTAVGAFGQAVLQTFQNLS